MICFADTSYWIALLREQDSVHRRAVAWRRRLAAEAARVVTTEAVLWEMLNSLSSSRTRTMAKRVYDSANADARIEVVPFEPALQSDATQVYANRHDKDWGIVDCVSFVVMERLKLTLALSSDHHFAQAGFEPLLLRDPPPQSI